MSTKVATVYFDPAGLSINSLTVNEAFCVTGSDDGFLRLWPLDFKQVYLEAGEWSNTVHAPQSEPRACILIRGRVWLKDKRSARASVLLVKG